MKKLSVVACSAFAALMFVACSDDPVTAAENPKAYLVTDDAGYHVVIPDMAGTCGYENIVFNNQRVLDTLKINFEGDPADCNCINDVWFNIDPLDADIKYLVYQNTVYEVFHK